MTRPCFLVIDKQYAGTISTRKLVIETAMLNVLTAYSGDEGIELLKRFPRVDGIILDSEVDGQSCGDIVAELRKIRPGLPIITVSPTGQNPCGSEDYHVCSYDPADLLAQLDKICPREVRLAGEESNSADTGGPK
ncbi:MAG TPA: response regulator [Terracidiphilus sp.]|nr:response regulator [Terracidiphilus sp.]